MESRIQRELYVRFGGEPLKTYRSNTARRWGFSLLKILIAVVIGALLLGGLYALFNTTIMPTVTSKIVALFGYSGT